MAENLEAADFAERSLYRLGYDNVEGYLANGLESWYKQSLPIATLNLASVQHLSQILSSKHEVFVLDVRRENEWNEGHIEGSTRIYLGKLQDETDKLPKNKPIFVVCKTGNRSSFGASILLRAGFDQVRNVLGGIDAWKKAKYPIVK